MGMGAGDLFGQRRVWLPLSVLVLVFAAGGIGAPMPVVPVANSRILPAAGGGGSSALIGEARRELGAMRTTDYQHETDVDEGAGQFYYDCSGFVDYALAKADPAALHGVPSTGSGEHGPLATDYEHHLSQGGAGWQKVAGVSELQPGDVVAWLATASSTTKDTGHVFVVAQRPTRNPKRADEWLVKIIDSTVAGHASDSRPQGTKGLGTGTVGLEVDPSGQPMGFYWKGGVSQPKRTEVALGRPN